MLLVSRLAWSGRRLQLRLQPSLVGLQIILNVCDASLTLYLLTLLFVEALLKEWEWIQRSLLALLWEKTFSMDSLWHGRYHASLLRELLLLVEDVMAYHCVLIRRLFNECSGFFPRLLVQFLLSPLSLSQAVVALAVLVKVGFLEHLSGILLRVEAGSDLRRNVCVGVVVVGEVVVFDNSGQLRTCVGEVGLGVETLGEDGDVIVVFGGFCFALNCANVNFLLVDHDHHLPLALVLAHATESGSSEGIFTHIVVGAFGLLTNQSSIRCVLVESIHDLRFLLQELSYVHVLLNLSLQS